MESFWLGATYIETLTNPLYHEILVVLKNSTNHAAHAWYQAFAISPASANFELHVFNYSGTAGDSLSGNCAKEFQSDSASVDLTCARGLKGMWWLTGCGASWLNGMESTNPMILWNSWHGPQTLAHSEMKIKPEKGLTS